MTMLIMNNTSAKMALGELNKNISRLGKQLKKVSTGMKVVGADDGASEYVISERMRVRINALEQDAANVQTGRSLLNVAEGAVQSQLDIMKTIKAKVIEADNDTNTDLDRETIQKEISQGFDQINNIAYETNYNNKLLLVGNKQVDEIYTWKILDKPETVPESDKLNLIENQYGTLDDQTGPFAVLPFYSITGTTAEPLLGNNQMVNLSGGTEGYFDDPQTASPATFTFDFSGYTSSNAEGLGFYTASNSSGASATYYVLTNDPTNKNYRHGTGVNENVQEIDIKDCTSAEIASRVAAAISGKGIVGTATASDSTVTVTTSTLGSVANNSTVSGWSQSADTVEKVIGGAESKKYGRSSASATGIGDKTVSGVPASAGTWIPPTYKDYYDPATDLTEQVEDVPGHYEGGTGGSKASMLINIAGVPLGSGFAVKGSGSTAYIRFVEGNSISRDQTGVYEIGINATITNEMLNTWNTYNPDNADKSHVYLSLSNGQLTLTSEYVGDKIHVADGFAGEPEADVIPATTKQVDFSAVSAYNGTVTNASGGVDQGAYHEGDRASYTMDLTAYDTTDSDKLEEFISALKGKTISSTLGSVEFIDRKVPTSFDAIRRTEGGNSVDLDLNILRTKVSSGQTVADAFISLMPSAYGYSDGSDTAAGTKGLKLTALYSETQGNSEIIGISQGNMSSYDIDFKSYIENNNISLPDDLDVKGFRLYCATCADQWFNFQFKSKDDPSDALRPASGSSGADLKTTIIDIADVTDVKSLVEAVYTQGGNALETIMDGKSHMLHFAADPEAGIITVYDDRKFDLRTRPYKNLQERGAKLADGVLDDVQKATKGIFVNDLVIQHTDHSSMNLHLQIPQTSMDYLFNYIPGVRSLSDFNVLTKANREELLGNQGGRMSRDGSRMVKTDEKGLLDTAIEYLTDANTLIGAQAKRLEMTHDNIIIQQETTQASESTIRDADMAKEMTDYAKANILSQTSQSMLAQANQNSSQVLSLLQ